MRHPRHLIPGAIAIAAAVTALSLLPGPAQAYPRWLHCEYVEAGAPGPAGNVLEISGNDNALVRRDGDLVLVGTSAANGPRDFEEIPCGTEATLTNIDRVVYRGAPVPGNAEHQFLLDERGGPLGPGASPEDIDSEIEVEVILSTQHEARPRVQLLAGDERDGVRLHAVSGVTEVSLEPWPWPRGLIPDADLTISAPPRTVELKVHGGGGGDVLDARGLDRHRGLVRSVLLAGDDGKDSMLGTSAGDVLEGGSGPDRLFGRGGRDFLYPSAGEDTAVGGPGDDFITGRRGSPEPDAQPDFYSGGAGDDYISAFLGGADEIACGSGEDEARADREDEFRDGSCERVVGERLEQAYRSGPYRSQ